MVNLPTLEWFAYLSIRTGQTINDLMDLPEEYLQAYINVLNRENEE